MCVCCYWLPTVLYGGLHDGVDVTLELGFTPV